MSRIAGRPNDVETITAFLRDHLGRDVSEVFALKSGAWSDAFAYRHDGRDWVIRISGLEEAFRKDERVVRHASPALPIPQVPEVGRAGDGFYALSERRTGEFLETIDGRRLRVLLPSLMATLDAMRLADVTDTRGYGGWDADGVGAYPSWRATLLDATTDRSTQHTSGWRSSLAASATGDAPLLEAYEVLRCLADHVPEDRHLVHADLMNRNVLVGGDRVTAVFDWGCAMYGDFLMDLAWIDFWAPWSPAWEGIDIVGAAVAHYCEIGLDVPNFAERLRACQIYIGITEQAYQAHMGFWPELGKTAARTLEVAGRQGPEQGRRGRTGVG
jgi:hygromycin-B 4-O-kinase